MSFMILDTRYLLEAIMTSVAMNSCLESDLILSSWKPCSLRLGSAFAAAAERESTCMKMRMRASLLLSLELGTHGRAQCSVGRAKKCEGE